MTDADVPDLVTDSSSESEKGFATARTCKRKQFSENQVDDETSDSDDDEADDDEEDEEDGSDDSDGDNVQCLPSQISDKNIAEVNVNAEADEECNDHADGVNAQCLPNPNNYDNMNDVNVDEDGELPKILYAEKKLPETSYSHNVRKKLPKISCQAAKSKLQSCLQQASEAFFNGNYHSSVSEFRIALKMLSNDTLKPDGCDKYVILYCLGLSHISIGVNKELSEGQKVFHNMIDEGSAAERVLGYLGLAKAYRRQNRFLEAVEPLQEGHNLITDGHYPGRCLWPGTLREISETANSPSSLQESFDVLLSECRNPPIPMAICRSPRCSDPFKQQMYLSDPEFKGYIQVICLEKCVVEFHRECWRNFKAVQVEKRSDKELLALACVTPDCQSTICKITTFDSKGKILKMLATEELSSKIKKSGVKCKQISFQHDKAYGQKRTFGKKVRGGGTDEKGKGLDMESGGTGACENKVQSSETVRHREDLKINETIGKGGTGVKGSNKLKSSDVTVAGHDEKTEQADFDPLETVQRTDFVALQRKRNEDSESDNVVKKPKKRREKEKGKKKLHLDAFMDNISNDETPVTVPTCQEPSSDFSLWVIPPFSGSSRAMELESESYSPSSTYGSASTMTNPQNVYWLQDDSLSSSEIVADNKESKLKVKEISRHAEEHEKMEENSDSQEILKGHVMLHFEVLLEKHGPCLADDKIIQQELESFPTAVQQLICDAGGIDKLLLQSLKFTAFDGYICILRDAGTARRKAQLRRAEFLSGLKSFKKIDKQQLPVKSDISSVNAVGATAATTAICVSASSASKLLMSTAHDTVCSDHQESATSINIKSSVKSCDVQPNSDQKQADPLEDLFAYREKLKQKSKLAAVETSLVKYDALDKIEDSSNLSVIEKFKKQVHEAASRERNKKRAFQELDSFKGPMVTNAASSINPLLVSKESYVYQDKGISTAYNDGLVKNEIKSDCDKRVKSITGLFQSQDMPEYTPFSVDQEKDNQKHNNKLAHGQKLIEKKFNQFPFIDKNDTDSSDGLSEALPTTMIMSKLSATAPTFHFPSAASDFKENSALILTTSNTDSINVGIMANTGPVYQTYGLDSTAFGFSEDYFLPNCDSTLVNELDFQSNQKQQKSFSYNLLPDSMTRCGLENKTARANGAVPLDGGQLDRLKVENDMLRKRCNSLAERQIQIQNRHTEELQIFQERLEKTTDQFQIAEKKSQQLEKDSELWKWEKQMYEEELEKLRSELSYTKTSLESSQHLVDVTHRLLNETKNALKLEKEERLALHEKYDNLLCRLERTARGTVDRTENLFAQPASTSSALVPVPDVSTKKKKTKQSFEKILNALSTMFPNRSRIEMSSFVQEVRSLRNNSLSGLTVQEIVDSVRGIILEEQAAKQKKRNALDLPYSLPSSIRYNVTASNNNGLSGEDVFQEEVDPCIICHEELNFSAASMLDCGHSFHTECVRKWFREQSTCPTCRNHALLPDEFPVLGRSIFQ